MDRILKPKRYLYSELFRMLCETVGRNKTILIDKNGSITCGELKDKVDGMAFSLIKTYGLKLGDRVSIVGANSIDWLLCYWAVIRAGGIAVLENDRLKGEEIARHYDDVDIKWLILGSVSEQLHTELMNTIGKERILSISEIQVRQLTPEETGALDKRESALPARREAFDVFTSGSTQKPKLALISQEALLFVSDKTLLRIPVHSEHHPLFAPLTHILGLYRMVTYLLLGETVVLAAKNSVDEIVRFSKLYSFNELTNVPTIIKQLAEHPEFAEVVKPKIEFLFMGGMKLSPEELTELETLYDARAIVGYGMTETAGSATLIKLTDSKEVRYETVGKPLEEVEVRISPFSVGHEEVDRSAEVGEILIRGKDLMNGYLVDGVFTSSTDEEGYFHTGDIGYFDSEGYIHITGRIKNIIIKGGENIMPGEIEHCIAGLPEVKDVIVMGVPDEEFGEQIAALIVPRSGCYVTWESVRSIIEKNHTRFKVPKYIFEYDKFPLNVNGKPDMEFLRKDINKKIKEEMA